MPGENGPTNAKFEAQSSLVDITKSIGSVQLCLDHWSASCCGVDSGRRGLAKLTTLSFRFVLDLHSERLSFWPDVVLVIAASLAQLSSVRDALLTE